ncbi:MAG: hypothetical protein FWC79_05915 [Oscillospiraceae bacterium]|nr:hypothetical protein [Oscillospiraceae bacterium]
MVNLYGAITHVLVNDPTMRIRSVRRFDDKTIKNVRLILIWSLLILVS